MARGPASLGRTAALAALLVLALVGGGCLKRMVYRAGARTVVAWVPVDPLDRKGPRDYFARIQGKREGGSAIAVLPFFVYPGPFMFEFTGGISDLDFLAESADAVSCFELFEEDFFGDLAHTIDLCGRYVQGGYQVFNSENQDQRFYPAANLLELRVEYDGAKVSYSSRPVGAPSYDLVTSFDFDWTTRLLPSFGATGFHKKGIYDLVDVTWTTTMPNDTTGEQGVGWHIQEAYALDLGSARQLEGATPDFAGAAVDLGAARSELSAAIGLAPNIIDVRIGKQVVRYLGRADKKLERAQDQVSDQDADRAIGLILKSTGLQGTAFQKLYGLDFKAQF